MAGLGAQADASRPKLGGESGLGPAAPSTWSGSRLDPKSESIWDYKTARVRVPARPGKGPGLPQIGHAPGPYVIHEPERFLPPFYKTRRECAD